MDYRLFIFRKITILLFFILRKGDLSSFWEIVVNAAYVAALQIYRITAMIEFINVNIEKILFLAICIAINLTEFCIYTVVQTTFILGQFGNL
jgi:hypothetical protein